MASRTSPPRDRGRFDGVVVDGVVEVAVAKAATELLVVCEIFEDIDEQSDPRAIEDPNDAIGPELDSTARSGLRHCPETDAVVPDSTGDTKFARFTGSSDCFVRLCEAGGVFQLLLLAATRSRGEFR